VILKPYGDATWERQALGHLGEVRSCLCRSEAELVDAIRDADILMADVDIQVTRAVIQGAKRLRGIMACSIGVDYIDLDAATAAGIPVANLPDYCVNAVAEFTIGLFLSVGRKICAASRAVLQHQWEERRRLRGFELAGKHLGLVGFGKIGQAVGRKAACLGMRVSYYDPFLSGDSPVPGCSRSGNLEELLEVADVVSVHTALTRDTLNLIDYRAMTKMKKTAILVNVARGGIVNEEDLARALREGLLAGVGLDVLVTEPIVQKHPLLALENVVITPHMAWNTHEAKENSKHSIVEEVSRMAAGQLPQNLVNKEVASRLRKERG
jgi:D-3-phosphoglycerate dehydrogenase